MSKEERMKEAVNIIVQGDEEAGLRLIDAAKAEGIDLIELLSEGFSLGIRKVGDAFGRGELFLPELILAAECMQRFSAYISEVSENNDAGEKKGTMIFATVEGDVHDIGKGIVISLLRTQGLEIVDLGRDVCVDDIIEAAEKNNADLIGTSALLTTTMGQQKLLEESLREKGIREKYKTMIGGAPTTQRWAKRIGADAYAEDAAEAVTIALELLS